MKSFADTCWDWSESKVDMEEALTKIDQGFAGDPAKAEVYLDQLLDAADELRAMRSDIINHACLMGPAPTKGTHSRRAVASKGLLPPIHRTYMAPAEFQTEVQADTEVCAWKATGGAASFPTTKERKVR